MNIISQNDLKEARRPFQKPSPFQLIRLSGLVLRWGRAMWKMLDFIGLVPTKREVRPLCSPPFTALHCGGAEESSPGSWISEQGLGLRGLARESK